ncbi:hypothetical protein ACIBEK_24200 [Nocardia fusca]|uniref:hypothetical protein n=1 Tax=Nocardia fusca TaxID=941183 RepID=UPI00379C764A
MAHRRAAPIPLRGVDGHVVTVEADIGRGLPSVQLPDLPGTALQDSRGRVPVTGLDCLRRRGRNGLPADIAHAAA